MPRSLTICLCYLLVPDLYTPTVLNTVLFSYLKRLVYMYGLGFLTIDVCYRVNDSILPLFSEVSNYRYTVPSCSRTTDLNI
jgi:hypothetical protein